MMTKEEMIELAKQSGWEYAHGESGFEPLWAFARLVADKERESCAKEAENALYGQEGCGKAAKAIRARGQE
jgi:hypothetical protein